MWPTVTASSGRVGRRFLRDEMHTSPNKSLDPTAVSVSVLLSFVIRLFSELTGWRCPGCGSAVSFGVLRSYTNYELLHQEVRLIGF